MKREKCLEVITDPKFVAQLEEKVRMFSQRDGLNLLVYILRSFTLRVLSQAKWS